MNLLIDADDTLWENNIYFERAFDDFYDFLSHSTFTREQVRAIFDEMEIANIRVNGYGSANFARNLTNCYRHLAERDVHAADIERILALGQQILDQPIELLDGVHETLAYLHGRHTLTVFTKGDLEEQRLKVERSGISHYFHRTAIVREKDVAAYRRMVDQHALDPASTWMVGNSPKSDINPALAAGLGAVFIPHERTWSLEHQEISFAGQDRLLRLERFSELQTHF
jgi:putative hydrolase of the HAD superfamily